MFLEKFKPLVKILHCRRQWRHRQISPLSTEYRIRFFKCSFHIQCQKYNWTTTASSKSLYPKSLLVEEYFPLWYCMWGEPLKTPFINQIIILTRHVENHYGYDDHKWWGPLLWQTKPGEASQWAFVHRSGKRLDSLETISWLF